MTKSMKIYVAGAYTAETPEKVEENTSKAIDAAIQIFKKGHYPYIPHLTHWIELRNLETNQGLKWKDYIEMDRMWLESCDALLYLSSSRGADIELEHAKKNNKKIFYSLEEIPSIIREYHFQQYNE